MGTDYVSLFDRATAELIIQASEEDLATLVESRKRPFEGLPVWRDYYDSRKESTVEFPENAVALERLKILLSYTSIEDLKTELILQLCKSDWLYVDY